MSVCRYCNIRMPFTINSVDSEQLYPELMSRAYNQERLPVSFLPRNPNTRLILPYGFHSPVGTETVVERMNGRVSTQAIRRSPSTFRNTSTLLYSTLLYIYCVTQPFQSNARRSTHSSPPPNITSKQTISRTADKTSAFQRRRA